ncbi:MAG TPA: hypothetical protein VIH99_09625 [Bdellovibrionota bacterium]|jgi:hypothetical protein
MKTSLFLLVLLAFSLPALAADEEGGGEEGVISKGVDGKTKVIYRKRTAVSFDDAVVEGAANNPEGVYVVTPPEKQFGSLLKLRPNFHRELMRDALLLK